MILGVCGFGFSGSGAVLDWLKDYSEVYVADKFEFSFVYKPDGIGDLGNAVCYQPVRYFSSDSAIRRFVQYMNRSKKVFNKYTDGQFQNYLNEYLSKIVQVKWKGSTSVHIYQASFLDYLIRQQLVRKIRWRLENQFKLNIRGSHWPEKEMYYSFMNESVFMKCTCEFIGNIISSMTDNTDSKILVLDQCFAANDPQASFKYFDSPKAICVVRDPRDNYLLAKKAYGYSTSFIPKQKVEDFIVYYRGLMESRKYDANNQDIIEINFEDMIYNSKDLFSRLEKKIGLSHVDISNFTSFRPNISINNTQLWLKYPQFKSDIDIIEVELKEYLYPFEKYNLKPSFNNRTF